MTHCIDFWKKWKKEPNFCGIGKSSAKMYDKYLDFVDNFSKEFGFEPEVVYQNVPQTAVKGLLRFKPESDIRKRAESQIAQTLQDKHAVTSSYVSYIIGLGPTTKPLITSPIVAAASGISKEVLEATEVKDRIRLINNALTTGQHNILLEVMSAENLDNEYEALAKILIWAKERINATGRKSD
jgi:hypothetical protein